MASPCRAQRSSLPLLPHSLTPLLPILLLLLSGGCDRGGSSTDGAALNGELSAAEGGETEVTFAPRTRVEDESVNAFVEQALRVTTARDYEEFRLLWSATDEPFARRQFDAGWDSGVRKIVIDVLQKMRDPRTNEIFYGMQAQAVLERDRLERRNEKAERQIVLVIRRENGQWRLSHAPDEVRRVVREIHDGGIEQFQLPPDQIP